MKTPENTEEDPDDPESAYQGDTGAATIHYLCESRSKYVTSDNPAYSVIHHLSGSLRVGLTEFYYILSGHFPAVFTGKPTEAICISFIRLGEMLDVYFQISCVMLWLG